MSEFKFSCPSCGQHIKATPEYSGQQISCPTCQKPLIVPQAPAAGQGPAAPTPPPLSRLSMATPPPHKPPAFTPPPQPEMMVRPPRKKLPMGLIYGGIALIALSAVAYFAGPPLMEKWEHRGETNAAAADQAAMTNQPPPAPKLSAREILEKVDETYRGLKTFSAEDKSVAMIDMSRVNPSDLPPVIKNTEEFKAAMKAPQTISATVGIRLQRPGHYRLEWERQGVPGIGKGLIWSAGEGDFLKVGTSAHVRVKNRDIALTQSAAMSGSLSIMMPQLFFNETNSLASVLTRYSKKKSETINGQDCYIMGGEDNGQQILIWINKETFLIEQTQIILGANLDSGAADEAANAGGDAQTKAMAKTAKAIASKLRGLITDTYNNIQTDQNFTTADFREKSSENPGQHAAGGQPPGEQPKKKHHTPKSQAQALSQKQGQNQ